MSAKAISEVECAEQCIGLGLPASVREWYCYHDATKILEQHSDQDPPIPLDKFAVIQWKSSSLIPFRYENQGVCVWSILLNGSDDPPVYVDVDSNGSVWQLQAPTFSAYVYACVWDYEIVLGQPGEAAAQNEPLSAQAIAKLERDFRAEPKTYGWPGSTQHRFAGKDHGILIWAADNQADWFVGAKDEAVMESVLRSVWRMDDVGKSFYDCCDIAKLVLAKIRNEPK